MKFAGKLDAASLGSIGAGVNLANPLLWSIPAESAAIAGAFGAFGLTYPRAQKVFRKYVADRVDGVLVESDETPTISFMKNGYRFGITRDYGYPVDIEDDYTVRHTAIVGQSGVGKTTLANAILAQQMARGGGFLFIDAKIDQDTLNQLSYLATLYGREDELYVLDVSDPSNSHSYSPLIHGDADEKSARLLNLQEENPAADHYRQSAAQAFRVLFDALDALEYNYTFQDFTTLCVSSQLLLELEGELASKHPGSSESIALSTFLEQYRNRDAKGGVKINTEMLKKNIGGMISRLSQFASGKFGQVFNTYDPEIDLLDILMNNKMLYVMIPTMGKDTAALNLAKIILSDLRSVVARIQSMPEFMRPFPNFIALCDEMGSYAIDAVRTLFEQGRSAHIQMYPAFQSFSQLNKTGPDFADIIIQNTWNKIFFKFGSKDAPEDAATILGMQAEFTRTIAESTSVSSSSQTLRTSPQGSDSGGEGVTSGWREMEGFVVKPDMLRSLGKGQAIMQSGSDIFCIDTPYLIFPKRIPKYEKAVFNTSKIPGLRNYNVKDRSKGIFSSAKEKSDNRGGGEY